MTAPVVGARAVGVRLAVRDLTRLRRHPATALNLLFLPVFLVVVWSRGFSAVARLDGFPARTELDWIVPLAVLSACTSAALITGFAMARDLESGFFDRLLLAPVRPLGLVAGPLIAGLGRALVPLVVVLAVALGLGADLPGGAAGLATTAAAAAGTALCASAWAVGLALRLGSVRRSVHVMQTGTAALLYLSTGLAPVAFMSAWLRAVARVNPMTAVLALARQGFLGPVTWDQTWPGLCALAAGATLLCAFAVRGLRRVQP
ncbi:MAG TPA: ABC transporter permease [Acidimicrobiales bacterium]|nr:ABC transporter permease [Acidimicrobiales bacterium]